MWPRRNRAGDQAQPTTPPPEDTSSEPKEDTAARQLRALVTYGRALRHLEPTAAEADHAFVCGVGMTPRPVLEAAAALGDASDRSRARPGDPDAEAALSAALTRFQAAAASAAPNSPSGPVTGRLGEPPA